MRVIVRKERPHPGAHLRFTDLDGHRFTPFATDAPKGQLADLELRHRRRARGEDRNGKDTGLRSLLLHSFAQNQQWCEMVALACELLAWTRLPDQGGQLGTETAPAAPASPSPADWSAAAACASASPSAGPGPARPPPQSPACRPSRPADQPEPSPRDGSVP
jgi:hypothetical protein